MAQDKDFVSEYFIATRKEYVLHSNFTYCFRTINLVKLVDSVIKFFYIFTDFLSSCFINYRIRTVETQ